MSKIHFPRLHGRKAEPVRLRSDRLESRYGWLLRLYPADRPRDEMLDVLLAGGRPFHREVVPLVIGGLRARSGGHQSLYIRWLYASRAAAALLILLQVRFVIPHSLTHYAVERALLWTALLAVCGFGAARPAAALVLTACTIVVPDVHAWQLGILYLLIAALLLVPGPRTPVANPVLLLLPALLLGGGPWWLATALALALLCSVIDERVLLAAGLAIGGLFLVSAVRGAHLEPLLVNAWSYLPFVVVGALLARRRARI